MFESFFRNGPRAILLPDFRRGLSATDDGVAAILIAVIGCALLEIAIEIGGGLR